MGRLKPLAIAALVVLAAPPCIADGGEHLADLSLQELANVEVTSVSKSPERIQTAPASVYVISHDDLMRSGVTSIGEALRLAPNLQIAQYSSSRYVAGARGFGGAEEAQNFSNKLLILVDGRSVYSPLFSGVYLDVQDLDMDDIDRIEVISGPGATLWGANAMNGVINIITRAAYLTDSTSLRVGAGNYEDVLVARYGDRPSNAMAWRVYGKAIRRGAFDLPDGTDAEDEWHRYQGGFRGDWTGADDTITAQGDFYHGKKGQRGADDVIIEGENVLGRWQHRASDQEWQLQGFYDYSKRGARNQGLAYAVDTVDLDLQHRRFWHRHRFVAGAGLRLHHYDIRNAQDQTLQLLPAAKTLWLGSAFVQDTYAVTDNVDVTLGFKLEGATYSGWSPLPDLRVAWRISDDHFVWAAASRAVRAVTPFDHDVAEMAPGVLLTGNRDFRTEKVNAFEIGYRMRALDSLTISTSVFFDDYDDLRTIEVLPSDPATLNLRWGNQMKGRTFGLESWAKWQVTPWWQLAPGVRTLRKLLEFKEGSTEIIGTSQAGNDPGAQFLLTSSVDLGRFFTLDATYRHVTPLPEPHLDAYDDLDASFGARVNRWLMLQLTGFNLLDRRHEEATQGESIERSLLLSARMQF